MESEFLTVREVATLLRLGNSTVYRYINEKILPATIINGKTYRIRADALAAFINRYTNTKEEEN